ncbi:hypothetical protein BLOT_012503 [Blomia tropicalis]|nr:hypothetical protein BLOT_012503 [Blomia tropicalis]
MNETNRLKTKVLRRIIDNSFMCPLQIDSFRLINCFMFLFLGHLHLDLNVKTELIKIMVVVVKDFDRQVLNTSLSMVITSRPAPRAKMTRSRPSVSTSINSM